MHFYLMSKFMSISFSLPVELSIILEEHVENEKVTRSELIKNALIAYFESNEARLNNEQIIQETYRNVLEIKEVIKNMDNNKMK